MREEVIAVGEEDLHERQAPTALSPVASGKLAWVDKRFLRTESVSCLRNRTMRWDDTTPYVTNFVYH